MTPLPRSIQALIEDLLYQQNRKVTLARVYKGLVENFEFRGQLPLDDPTNLDTAIGYVKIQQKKNEQDIGAIYATLETQYGIFLKEKGDGHTTSRHT